MSDTSHFAIELNQKTHLGTPGVMDIVTIPLDGDLIVNIHRDCEAMLSSSSGDHNCATRVYRVLGLITKKTLERIIISRIFETYGPQLEGITNVLNNAIPSSTPLSYHGRTVDEIFDAIQPGYATPVAYFLPGGEGHFVFVYKNPHGIEYLIDISTQSGNLEYYEGRDSVKARFSHVILNVPCIPHQDVSHTPFIIRTQSFGGKQNSRRKKIKKTYKNKK